MADYAKCPDCGADVTVGPRDRVVRCRGCGATCAVERSNPFASEHDVAQSAAHAFDGTSMVPERRAQQVQKEYADYLNGIYEEFNGKVDFEELERFRDGYRRRYSAWLSAHGRVLSPMITGPSNFPVRRNQKANETEMKRLDELIKFQKKAEHALRRLVAGKQTINTADKGAAEKLTEKRAGEMSDLDHMKAANALWRKLKGKVEEREAIRQVLESLPGPMRKLAFQSSAIFRTHLEPFASYEITNTRARANRLEGQTKVAERMAATPTGFYEGADHTQIEDDAEAGRVRISFPRKPSPDIIAKLKARGFRWAPSTGAWQRQRTERALRDAQEIVGQPSANAASAPEGPKKQDMATARDGTGPEYAAYRGSGGALSFDEWKRAGAPLYAKAGDAWEPARPDLPPAHADIPVDQLAWGPQGHQGRLLNPSYPYWDPTWQKLEGQDILYIRGSKVAAIPSSGRRNAARYVAFNLKSREVLAYLLKGEVRDWLIRTAQAEGLPPSGHWDGKAIQRNPGIQGHKRNPGGVGAGDEKAASAYRTFHGVPPAHERTVEMDLNGSTWWLLGLGQEGSERAHIQYIPPKRSRKHGNTYDHVWGDTLSGLQHSDARYYVRDAGDAILILGAKVVPENGIIR